MDGSFHQWSLIVATACLCGWWLCVRPGAAMRGVSTSVSFLIILMAGLLVMLAVSGQGEPRFFATALHNSRLMCQPDVAAAPRAKPASSAERFRLD